MISRLRPLLPYYPDLLAGLLILSVVLLLLAFFTLWRSRSAERWRVRHDSGIWGGRFLVAGLSMLISTVIIGGFSAVIILSFDYVDAFFPPSNPYDVEGVALTSLPGVATLTATADAPPVTRTPRPTLTTAPTTAVPTVTLTFTFTPSPSHTPTRMTLTHTPIATATPSPKPTQQRPTETPEPTAQPTGANETRLPYVSLID